MHLTFMGPRIAKVFPSITNKMQCYTIYLFSVKCSTCFRRFLRPSSGAQNCIYSIGYFVKPTFSNLNCYPPRSWKGWNQLFILKKFRGFPWPDSDKVRGGTQRVRGRGVCGAVVAPNLNFKKYRFYQHNDIRRFT